MDEKKEIDVLCAQSVRELVLQIEENGIQKDDIVQVIDRGSNIFLLYYR